MLALQETQRWAKTLHLTLEPHELRGPADFDGIFAAIGRAKPDALMTAADPLIASYARRIVEFAAKNRLPSMYPGREFVADGGLMFYGGSIPEMYRRAAVYVDRILKGAKPSELPWSNRRNSRHGDRPQGRQGLRPDPPPVAAAAGGRVIQ